MPGARQLVQVAAAGGRALISAGAGQAASSALSALTTGKGGKHSRIQRIEAAAQEASKFSPGVAMRVYSALAGRGRHHGISGRDIRAFNRVLRLVARVNKHMHHHYHK